MPKSGLLVYSLMLGAAAPLAASGTLPELVRAYSN